MVNGVDVFECQTGESSVSYSLEYELGEVARFWGMRSFELEALESEQQADLIARYRTKYQIDATIEYKRYIDMKTKQARNATPKTGGKRIGRRR